MSTEQDKDSLPLKRNRGGDGGLESLGGPRLLLGIPDKKRRKSNVQVSFPPFLFECFLLELVDDEKSMAKIGNGLAAFTLPKIKQGLWRQLEADMDKDRKRAIREEAIIKIQKKALEKAEAKAVTIREENKFTLENMMKLEEEERSRIQKLKDEACKRATEDLEAWKHQKKEAEAQRRLQEINEQNISKSEQQCKADRIDSPRTEPNPSTAARTESNPRTAARTEHNPRTAAGVRTSQVKSKQVDPPPPRSAGCIKVHFTPRVFPTALRESLIPEEEEWLRKQAEVRRAANADLAQMEDLKEEEKNPDWLKNKGDKFFTVGNYQAALNAYDLAIKLNARIPALFSNRAACHLKLRNLHKAIEDSSRALELLTPPVPANAAARTKAHVRKGTAFCQLELYVEGLQDYQAALKIDPHNEALQKDAAKIREIIQSS